MHNPRLELLSGGSVIPQTIYGIGRNYAEHARELAHEVPSEPIVFLKSLSSLRPLDEGGLAYPHEVFHHEAEVVLLIGKALTLGHQATWSDVSAIGLGLDLTRRDVQTTLKANGLPWTKAKCFLGAAPVSPFVAREKFTQTDAITFTLTVEGEVRQRGNTADMLHSVPAVMTYLLAFTPLFPGDLIFTGTPSGVGPIKHDDRFTLAFNDLDLAFHGRL